MRHYSLWHYLFIYERILVCVCVCVCVREPQYSTRITSYAIWFGYFFFPMLHRHRHRVQSATSATNRILTWTFYQSDHNFGRLLLAHRHNISRFNSKSGRISRAPYIKTMSTFASEKRTQTLALSCQQTCTFRGNRNIGFVTTPKAPRRWEGEWVDWGCFLHLDTTEKLATPIWYICNLCSHTHQWEIHIKMCKHRKCYKI